MREKRVGFARTYTHHTHTHTHTQRRTRWPGHNAHDNDQVSQGRTETGLVRNKNCTAVRGRNVRAYLLDTPTRAPVRVRLPYYRPLPRFTHHIDECEEFPPPAITSTKSIFAGDVCIKVFTVEIESEHAQMASEDEIRPSSRHL